MGSSGRLAFWRRLLASSTHHNVSRQSREEGHLSKVHIRKLFHTVGPTEEILARFRWCKILAIYMMQRSNFMWFCVVWFRVVSCGLVFSGVVLGR